MKAHVVETCYTVRLSVKTEKTPVDVQVTFWKSRRRQIGFNWEFNSDDLSLEKLNPVIDGHTFERPSQKLAVRLVNLLTQKIR